jgi:hypothetical protein
MNVRAAHGDTHRLLALHLVKVSGLIDNDLLVTITFFAEATMVFPKECIRWV